MAETKEFNTAYELIRCETLTDIHSEGYVLRHKKTGARVALIENDDDNKVFYIGFRTPVSDSTGVPHINEHSVLCGSEKYPLKDPFVELVKGSLNTFLNAMTYPDKTVYPVASTNEQDFKNLMDVYMDAVLHPNIYNHPEIFKQEGWHYELDDLDGELTLNGVVYNEMKGAFSSPDDVLQRTILNSLFPDTTYQFESGGDPKDIPSLTYEDFLNFHRRYYHPSNAYIYLYGDMNMNERLDYLDREYLSKYDAIELDSTIKHQDAFEKPVYIQKKYPIASGEDAEDQTYLSLNFAVSDILNPILYQAFDILDYALLNVPGAPIRQALLDAGIGKDILGGYDAGTLQPIYSIVAKGANPEDRDRFVEIIRQTLKEQIENGIDRNALKAAISSAQFRLREADFGSYPKGLMYGLQILDSWLYEDDRPFLHMYGIGVLDDLMEKVETGYFEQLTDMYLLSNPHASVVVIEPEAGLTAKEDEELRKTLQEYKESLSDEEKQKIIDETIALKEYQQTPDTQEDIEKIPLLRRSDLKKEIRPIYLTELQQDDTTILQHEIETNGIQYFDLAFDAADVSSEKLPYLALLSDVLGAVDTERYSYFAFSNAVNIHTGGLAVDLKAYPTGHKTFTLQAEVRTKFLYGSYEQATALIEEMLFSSKFDDTKRLREIVREAMSHLEMKFMSAGNAAASVRLLSKFSPIAYVLENTDGIAYYRFLKELDENFDARGGELAGIFDDLMKRVFRPERLVFSTTGKEESLSQAKQYLPKLLAKLHTEPIDEEELAVSCDPKNEGFQNAAQIQYVCRAGDFRDAGYDYAGTLQVLRVLLGYDYFWQNVRVEGGAYGCMSHFARNGDLYFVSYRDPHLMRTKDVFEDTADYLSNFEASERDMTKYVIGTVSTLDKPLTPSQHALRAINAYFTGVREDELQKQRDAIIAATPEDIRALAPLIRDTMAEGYLCVIGNEEKIAENRQLFDTVEQLF